MASCRGEAKKPSRQPPVSAALRDRRRILPSACSWTRQRPAGSLELPGEVPVVFRMVKKIHQSPTPSSYQVDRVGALVLRRRCPCAIRSSRAGHRRHLGRLQGSDLPRAIASRGASAAASCVCVCIYLGAVWVLRAASLRTCRVACRMSDGSQGGRVSPVVASCRWPPVVTPAAELQMQVQISAPTTETHDQNAPLAPAPSSWP